MSLVVDILNYVKQNPGKNGKHIQDKFIDSLVAPTIQQLESKGLIKWENDGYRAVIIKELQNIHQSFDPVIKAIEEIIPQKISAKCINCKFFAESESEVERYFGFKRSGGYKAPSNYCRKCQNNKVISFLTLLGRELSPTGPAVKHYVKNAKNMRHGIYIEGIVIRKEIPSTVELKDGGTIRVCSARLIDDYDDEINITLWSHDVDLIKNGQKIRINNGYTNRYRNEISVSVGKFGHITILHYGPNEKPRKSFIQKLKSDFQFSFENYIITASDIDQNEYLDDEARSESEKEARKRDFAY